MNGPQARVFVLSKREMFSKINSFSFLMKQSVEFSRVFVRHRRPAFHRKPLQVLTEEGKNYFDEFGEPKIEPIIEPELDPAFKERNKLSKNTKVKSKSKTKTSFREQVLKTDEKVLRPRIEGVPIYDKLGENNREFVQTMTQLRSRKLREKQNLICLEGKRLISDGIDAGLQLDTIYFSVEENLIGIKNLSQLEYDGVKFKKVFYKDLKLFSEHVTCPGVMGIFQRPSPAFIEKLHSQRKCELPVTLVADNIRDPGNLGTLIRSAAGAGIERVVCTKGCADVWESKVIRSGCGAHFRIPIVYDIEWPLIVNYLPKNECEIYIADIGKTLDSNSEQISTVADTEFLTSPVSSEAMIVNEETGEIRKYDETFEDENTLAKFNDIFLENKCYTDINYFSTSKAAALVVGGETQGISLQALKLCIDYGGFKTGIPLECGVESLNSSIAASIILYEMKRQFTKIMK